MVKAKLKQTEMGMVPEDWEISTLGDISSKITDGSHFSPKTLLTGTKIMATVKDMKYGGFDFNNTKKISDADFEMLVRNGCSPETGDILISKDGANCLDIIFVYNRNERIVLLSSIAIVRLKGGYNPQFYRYYLLSPGTQEIMKDGYVSGSAIPRVILKDFRRVPVVVPPKQIQDCIASILSDLDDKIELNQQTNKTLETIGEALFKHWFVDFEFPDEKGKPYKSSGGKMIFSEKLGKEMPEGWGARRLGDFISIERGLSYSGKGLAETGLPMINLGTMAPHKGFIYEGLKFYQCEYKQRNLVKPGDLVIANTDITQKRDVLGSPVVVPSDLGTDKILFTHHIYGVRNTSKVPNLFIYHLLQSKEYRGRVRGFATGTTVLALPEDVILDFVFVLPEDKTLMKFTKLTQLIKDRMGNSILQNKNLSQIRDSLLPRLMSGKIRVPVEVKV